MKLIAKELNDILIMAENFFLNQDKTYWYIKPSPEKWSKLEIVGHLNDSAFNNIQRFVRATHENMVKVYYQQDEWVKYQQYAVSDVSDTIMLFFLLNKQIIRILENFPDHKIRTEIILDQNDTEILSIHDVGISYIQHLLHHLKQIGIPATGKSL